MKLRRRVESLPISVFSDVPLSNYTTWQVGGEANFFLLPENLRQVSLALKLAETLELPWYPLGNGSNVLFPEEGYPGLVIKLGRNLSAVQQNGSSVRVQSGAPLGQLLQTARRAGSNCFNFLYGIPGTVGGGIMMNAGAYGSQLSDHVKEVRYFDREGQLHSLRAGDCQFGYRTSLFQDSSAIIMDAEFELTGSSDQSPLSDLKDMRNQALPRKYPSAGCVFKNPPEEEVSAGELLDRSGCKGLRVGDAVVSSRHANFILNLGAARSGDIASLIDIMRERVYKEFGITLVTEVDIASPQTTN